MIATALQPKLAYLHFRLRLRGFFVTERIEVHDGFRARAHEEEDVFHHVFANCFHQRDERACAVDAELVSRIQETEASDLHARAQDLHLHEMVLPEIVDRAKRPQSLDGFEFCSFVILRG